MSERTTRREGAGFGGAAGAARRALLASAVLGLSLIGAAPAAATITFFMEWTATSSDDPDSLASLGTAAYAGRPGDQVTLTLYLGLDEGEWLAAYGVSLEWDPDFGDELDLVSLSEATVVGAGDVALSHLTPFVGEILESDIETVGTVRNFEAYALSAALAGGSETAALELATLQFELTDTLAADGEDLFVGFFDPGVDEVLGCPPVEASEECLPDELVFALIGERVVLEPASVSPIPEPGAPLLGRLALAALATLKWRRRRGPNG